MEGQLMEARKITAGLLWVGAVDWDRRLFDELIPLPDGTSYNAYLIQGSEKTALVDSVDPAMSETLFKRLEHASVKKIDYVVAHHGEQDHSGVIPEVLKKFPMAKVLCSPKAKTILMDLMPIEEGRFRVVQDGEKVSLGDKTLQFIHFPWVHWPETMLTYVPELKTLLTCDLFGSHFATNDLYATDEMAVLAAAKRYYAEIMMPFAGTIERNMDKLKGLDIKTICPSHGPVYARPALILDAYKEWTAAKLKNKVVVPYVSMHGSTKAIVNYLVEALTARGVAVEQFNMVDSDAGKLAESLIDAATIVVGSPMVLSGLHPKVAYAVILANALRPKTKYASLVGSFSWGGKLAEQLVAMVPNLKLEIIPPVLVKGHPKEADLKALDALADAIKTKHQALEN
jgi:flavorubredoxin